jgi:hypothetical protein
MGNVDGPTDRRGRGPDLITNIVLLLLSDDTRYINDEIIQADGGIIIRP